ncbi:MULTISPECIES: peroxidase family protein [unclassified Pseudomonas]|uniref:peroxidase family protein n=4 Tax=Pseudomonas TaxID=286 RepID=UPI000EA92956|nr:MULTISPECIES: peroxidase family protein [unclassified Pseudomonas]AYF85838.1 heme peroxidase [Pseudomonas sp. DY-1]MDH4651797.1 heme peroxidase [Pseudomonas sp. BN606]
MATYIKSDLEFILQQILISEAHAAGEDLSLLLPNSQVPWGLRTVDGSFNHLVLGQTEFGAADNLFPRLLDPVFRIADNGTTYSQTSGLVFDSQPRTISNLIVDQTANNPAAVEANGGAAPVLSPGLDGIFGTPDDQEVFFIPNTTPDEGLSAPFNSWFTFFGQFFDHGLDLVSKGGSGTIFIQLQEDDPLFNPNSATNFLVLTRATNQPGADGVLGTEDDIHEHTNTTSPFVDQNQTYSSHPSHQVFLRAYVTTADGPVTTGKLITNRDLVDGVFGNGNDVDLGGMATWATVKAQARDVLGINLTDADVGNIPLLATDPYGNFIKGANGYPQVVMSDGAGGTFLVEGDPTANGGQGISLANAVRTGHAFLDDIAHSANPFNSQTGALLAADADGVAGTDDGNPATYDNELLDSHYIAGDGRVNENIGLTAVHHVFHSEHNRLVDHTKEVILSSGDVDFLNQWLLVPVVGQIPADTSTLVWNGERLFQAAKFGTEMQYQHLVFEEFARKVQPNVDAFLAPTGFDATIDPSIVAEFAHVVYRFGHSMLTETIDRLDPNFVNSEIGLIAAFLNPLAFAASGADADAAAGAIVRGVTRQQGNEIDEFVTEALRNNLLGLPLDLATINIARGRDAGIPSLNAARREFFEATGDSQLEAYSSWVDFMGGLKHEASLINFIAAYGTHSTITGALTLDGKRAAAMAIVLGGAGAPEDRLDFLHSTGEWASGANGVTTTGLDLVDFWVGGLAEKQMPFGGLLGSTFNFVFETQLEALQNGDRFYYLGRLAGLNFLTEMEQNSFAKMVMRNTDVDRLPADIFTAPGLILEVDQTRQFNAGVVNNPGADGILGDDPSTPLVDESADDIATPNEDPLGDNVLVPLVIRDNPATPGADTNYLRYTGEDHVVLGGTNEADILIASIGDDTIWGDGGNDRIEGGDGVDSLNGGAGDDIITDMGGDDNIKGDDGNDVIHGGNGFNLILGGAGNDFIITGEDVSETFGGTGNDFIYGAKGNLQTAGNEGDDWIEIGTQDGAPGDNFSPFALDEVAGNDVFVGGGGFDEMIGEGGDDIFFGSEGADHFDGGSGFDWVSYKFDPFGVLADMIVDDFFEPPVPASNAGIFDRFAFVEGLAGSQFGDVLRGDNADAAEIAENGPLGSVLNQAGIDLIAGLQEFLGAGVTSFGGGNIILGGGGSDILEGRGGDDLIDGDRTLNAYVSVRTNPSDPATEIRRVDSIGALIPDMLSGAINPSQLVIVREVIQTVGPNYDTAVYSGNFDDYQVDINNNGTTLDFSDDVITVTHLEVDVDGNTVIGADGVDRLTGIERLQFNDQSVALVPGGNAGPQGLLQISDNTPQNGQVLTASSLLVTDADNITGGNPTGAITGPVAYFWQRETVAGSGLFVDIVNEAGERPETAQRDSFRVTADLDGLALRVRAVYKDADGVLENVFSNATAAVNGNVVVAPPAAVPQESFVASPGVHLVRSDLQFILDQIIISERHAAGENLLDIVPNSRGAFGLRTVDGSFNNLVPGQEHFGAADQPFPNLVPPVFRDDQDGDTMNLGPGGVVTNTDYGAPGNVADTDPRTISNLIVDQTITNPAAVQAYVDAGLGTLDPSGVLLDLNGAPIPAGQPLFIPNTAPDEGLSAGFNSWFTLFGQFFDHGLDLVTKGGNGFVFVPLQPDDPLFVPGGTSNFMILTRTSNDAPGQDGLMGTADDIIGGGPLNTTTPFVDQNQTYTSHASHQVFLREYEPDASGNPVATGRMLDGVGGLPTWAEVKAQAAQMLGIQLTDGNIGNVPLLATDLYGKFIPGANGFAQIVTLVGDQIVLVEGVAGGLAIPGNALFTGHAFLDDIAHAANPFNSQTGALMTADADAVTGPVPNPAFDPNLPVGPGNQPFLPQPANTFDNELLDRHFITGDGRGNENIGLTSVHHVFHAEHNRMVDQIKAVVLASNDPDFISNWQNADGSWNGERLFQAARFTTEMQYQHLVFEEFARKVQPQVDVFFNATQVYDTQINPAIVAEFAHVVYRFGHSMLTETVDRLNPDFTDAGSMDLIDAFLNPLAFNNNGALSAEEAAGNIVRGMTRQAGNEIDEFVTEALRNNLLGLPLDLATINIARGRDTGVPTLNAARQDFYNATGDSQLRPYTSWVDFAAHLKHQTSIVNFIAAYGTHAELLAADVNTTAEKRAVAFALVFGGDAIINEGTAEQRTFTADTADRLAFLNGPAATTGVNDIDLWIGGLAERQMPFGGLLGSTFNFVFENQMEKLQDGDRFYYLERTASMNFLTELENNSFAKMVMANTNAIHLPGDIFSDPGLILEVDITRQFNADVVNPGADGILGDDPSTVGIDESLDDFAAPGEDPQGGSALLPWVIRDNPVNTDNLATAFYNEANTNYLRYTGDEHVVLGGTDGDDVMIASIGDDTIWGDGGRDRIEGGDGNDLIRAGDGDDIITDRGGDDNIQGDGGNDVIHGGNGINLLLGGFGNDFIVSGEDATEIFGGVGNDFILGTRGNEAQFGNEGDDWLELGGPDGNAGDNFNEFGLDNVPGNDVYIGERGIIDRMDGEGGDDIMLGNGGEGDRYVGASGFDWAVFRDDPQGVNIEFDLRAFDETPVTPSTASLLTRFEFMEGLSGSSHSDILKGDDRDAAAISTSGVNGSILTNIGLIAGLGEFLGTGVTSFGAGNIILGGSGSDIIAGRGGDDRIDGDRSLTVYISVKQNADGTGPEIDRAFSMTELVHDMLTGRYTPGQLVVTRELLAGNGAFNYDTAEFSGNRADYTVLNNGDGTWTVTDTVDGRDGSDRLSGIERLQFNDVSEALVVGLNSGPVGLATISDATPEVGTRLVASIAGVTDANNAGGIVTGPVSYYWQADVRGDGIFEDIIIENAGAELARATGPSFLVTAAQAGLAMRLKAIYKDGNGVLETVYSAVTAPVSGTQVNDVPTGAPVISDTTPAQGQLLTATRGTIADADGTTTSVFSFQWQSSANGTTWTNIGGATSASFTPGALQVGLMLRVVASFTDDQGFLNQVASAATAFIGGTFNGGPGNDILTGTAGDDVMNGGGGNDTLNGGAGNDLIDGATGADSMTGGAGNDTFYVDNVLDSVTEAAGDGRDMVRTTLASYSLGANVEDLAYIGSSNFTAVGNGLANVIAGAVGNDTLSGGGGNDMMFGVAGNDVLNGNAGADRMVGGVGDDTFYVDNALDVVVENTGEGSDMVRTTLSSYTLGANLEVLVSLGAGAFTGTGNALANRLVGGTSTDTLDGLAGNDILHGLTGNDVLNGGADADTMMGGSGNDTYYVDNALDFVAEAVGDGTDVVRTTLSSYSLGTNVENLVFIGSGAFSGTGNTLANRILGGSDADTLNGLGGNDVLVGGAGNDTMNGGAGNDIFQFGAGFGQDQILGFDAIPAGGQDRLHVANLGITAANFAGSVVIAGVGADTLVTIGADSITLVGVASATVTQADFIVS